MMFLQIYKSKLLKMLEHVCTVFEIWEIEMLYINNWNFKKYIRMPKNESSFEDLKIVRATPSAAGPHSRVEGCLVVAVLC